MESLQEHWWMAWSVFAVSCFVAWRVRQRGGDESLFTRIRYALIPHADPMNENRRDLSGRSLAIMGGGILLSLIMLVIVNLLAN